jgi:hypothetical protein
MLGVYDGSLGADEPGFSDGPGVISFAFSSDGGFFLIVEQANGQLQYLGFNGVIGGAAAAEIGLPSLEGFGYGSGGGVTVTRSGEQRQELQEKRQEIEKQSNECGREAAQVSGPLAPGPLDTVLDVIGGILFTGLTDGTGGPALLKWAKGAAFGLSFTTLGKMAVRQDAWTGCMVNSGELPIQAITGPF